MDTIDRRLLQKVQEGLPLAASPYRQLAEEIGISEEEVIDRLQALKKRGIIRRLGGVFDSRQLGYVSALCAVKVDISEADKMAAIINNYPGVTHNYLRDNDVLNLWFTLTCSSAEEFDDTIAELTDKLGRVIYQFPVKRRYKINFSLPMNDS